MKSFVRFVSVIALAAALFTRGGYAAPVVSPLTASVGAVTVTGDTGSTSPALVCSGTPGITVAATVTGTYHADSGPTVTSDSAQKCGNSGGANNNFCETGDPLVACMKTVKNTTVTYSAKTVTAGATDGNSSIDPQNGPSPLSFTGTLAVPSAGPDDKKTVTVSATSSEAETTTKETSVSYWGTFNSPGGGSCGGSQIGSTTTTTDAGYPATVTNTSSIAAGTGLYVLDIEAPTVDVHSNHPNPITQGSDEFVNLGIKSGSALTPYSVSLQATGPGPTYSAGPFGDYFGGSLTSGAHWGVDTNEQNNTAAVFIACDAPVGTYSLQTTTKTQDLCGGTYADITNTTKKNGNDLTFEVIPAVSLPVETLVLSELPLTGDYGIDECFNNALVSRKVNGTPGSVHLAAVVNPTVVGGGACAASISGVAVQLTLDNNFKYDRTGNSPAAHVFVGAGSNGFDLHNAAPLVEVTTAPGVVITAPPKNTNGGTITVNLGSMVIPVGSTIYIRAHAIWSQPFQAPSDSSYVFSSSASAITPTLTNGSSTTIVGNPTIPGTGLVCNASGVLQ
jgi:hypothetical protein